MDLDSDPLFPPTMSTAEMLNTFETDLDGSMEDADNFFDSALSTDPSNRLFSDDTLSNPLFQSIEPTKLQAMQDPASSVRSRQPISTSPESSLQDSSSDSSGHRKRKSSSKSSHSGLSTVDSPKANTMAQDSWKYTNANIKREPTLNCNSRSSAGFEASDFNHRASADSIDFGSATSSPSQELALNNASYAGPRHVAIQYQDSPISTASFFFHNANTRESSPTSNTANPESKGSLNQPARPSPLGAQEEYLDTTLLRGMEQRSWPFGEDAANVQPGLLSMLRPQGNAINPQAWPVAAANHQPSTGLKSTLIVHPTPQKSRVETQIPLRLTLFPLPKGVTKLHLPAHTISKPKLLARPPPAPSPDTLELHTMLVCTSAMQDPTKLRKALFKAANPSRKPSEGKRRLSAGESPDGHGENQPLNGGEVRICEGCIIRERKRAARKKCKKPEEEEPWQRNEAKRVVVFNTNEVKEWQPPQSGSGGDGQQDGGKNSRDNIGFDFPDGAMQVDIPMRIACYCRHQSEKHGFQVVLTIMDHQHNLVSQTITNSIIITDDHKTHPPGPMQTHGPFLGDQAQILNTSFCAQGPVESYGPGLYRNAHSTTDLQGLQQSFNPHYMSQMTPYAVPQRSSQTIRTTTTTTPRNLSRQASPSAPGGPVQKKRKASGGLSRVRDHLTMTKLQTDAPAQEHSWAGPASASSAAASPYTPVFPHGSGPQQRPQAHHVSRRSEQFPMGPQNSFQHGLDMFSQANRSQSVENFATVPQMYSAPPSTLPSRAPSPSRGLQMATPVHANFGANPINSAFPTKALAQTRPSPTIHKLIPSEGPKAGGIEVTCLGSGFYQGLEVMFGESLATTTTYWGENSLVCLLPPALRAGTVPVTFKHQFQQQQQLSFGRFPSPPLSKPQTLFKYVDDDEQELMRQALLIVSQKMNGDVNDAGQVARWIVSNSNAGQGSWSGNEQGGGHQRQATNGQSYLAGTLDCEGAVLKCLELIDLDESPFPAHLNMRKLNGQTVVHLAASLGYLRLVAGLLARGANPDSRDKNGMSPMHMAALNGNAQIVRRLRVAGGDSTMRSLLGYTPADMATSQAVLDAVETLSLPRSRSADPRSMVLAGSMVNSSYLAPSASAEAALEDEDSSEEGDDEDSDDSEAVPNMGPIPTQQWEHSRRNSATVPPALATPELESNHGYMYAVAAMAAWRDQIATQLQQLQQSVNFTLPNLPALPPLPTLPPMPNLPDYQVYPMVRRFSPFVPHRHSRPSSSAGSHTDSKEQDSNWWEFLTGGNSPPAYEEIYPPGAREDMNIKTASAVRAAADAAVDQKCSTVYDSSTLVAGSSHRHTVDLTTKQGEELKLVQRKNVKRLGNDSRLFYIWIPLLVLVVAAMLKDRVPQLWHATSGILLALSEQYHGTGTVAVH